MSNFLSIHKQHRYYVPTCCTHIAKDVDPQKTWPVPQCGAPVFGNSAYCEEHHKRMYRPAKPLQVRELVQEIAQEDPESGSETKEDQLKELV